jgi:hypothetical protein
MNPSLLSKWMGASDLSAAEPGGAASPRIARKIVTTHAGAKPVVRIVHSFRPRLYEPQVLPDIERTY